jgi:hypothetical protein
MAFVASDISFELFAPPSAFRLRNARVFAVAMEMPETSVNKNAAPVAWQNNVWIAGKIASVQPEAVSHRIQDAANCKLGLCVLAANPAHQAAARLRAQSVCHYSKKLPQI